jgi:hypothetical protein
VTDSVTSAWTIESRIVSDTAELKSCAGGGERFNFVGDLQSGAVPRSANKRDERAEHTAQALKRIVQ